MIDNYLKTLNPKSFLVKKVNFVWFI